MRIDATHKPWLYLTLGAIALATAIYIPYARATTDPGGGTPTGLTFGVIALALMVFAALLSLRKRFPIWRIGRTRLWLKAHLWLGFLALPMVLFHAAFQARGLLAFLLMALTFIVVLSGVYGAWLQHTIPSKMFRDVPYETIYDQIPVIRAQLLAEAELHATNVTDILAPARGAGATVVLTMLTVPELGDEVGRFNDFFSSQVRPYLNANRAQAKRMLLYDRTRSAQQFDNYRKLFPIHASEPIAAIEDVAEEKRQLDHQVRLHQILHGWLLCHVPLSAALLLLGFIHAIVALHY
jgi:hypothetical protein